ncbi:MAG: fumarylacetoacetate hydrolase family protein, partial [Microbacteriaceae bacterium]
MKLARINQNDRTYSAVIEENDTQAALLPASLGSIDDLVRLGLPEALKRVNAVLADCKRVPLSEVKLLAPLTQFNRDILCCGWNYWDHFYESKGKREGQDPVAAPEHPTFFTKGPNTVVGPHDPIAIDMNLSQKWDYEAELALVIGKGGRSITEEHAAKHIFGYFVANDISQRDLQRAHGGQWLKGKSIDQTMPIGPWITTADEVDLSALVITQHLNGELLQNASVTEMAFPIERLIAELSWG